MLKALLWVVGIVAVLGALAGVGVVAVGKRMQAAADQSTTVWVQTITTGEMVETVSAPGVVEPLTKVEISARVSARIVELPYKEGDEVFVDGPDGPALLVALDDSDIQAQLESSQKRRDGLIASVAVEEQRIAASTAALAGTLTMLEDAKRELDRQQALRETGDVSVRVLEQAQRTVDEAQSRYDAEGASLEAARLGLEVSRFNIEAAEADIRQIGELLNYTTIRTPIDGVVTRLNVEVGEIAITGTMNNPGTVMIEVADLSRMLVVARIDEANIRDVEPGQPVNVRLIAYPGKVFTGCVQSVALSVANATGSQYFETKVLLDETEEFIRSGLSADVEVEVRNHEDQVLIPSQAVVSRPVDGLPAEVRKDNPLIDPTRANTIVVFRIEDGKAVATPVRIGASDSLNTIVLEGLDADTQIVTGPYAVLESLQHGDAIEIGRLDGEDIEQETDDESGRRNEPRRDRRQHDPIEAHARRAWASSVPSACSILLTKTTVLLIELKGITKIYKMGVERVHALDGVDINVDEGEYVAIMGSSGSGKSTLMNMLGCLDRPTAGSYLLAGDNTSKMGAAAQSRVRNERIGFVFQSFELMPRTPAWKNVALPMMYSRKGWAGMRKKAMNALDRVGLKDRSSHKPSQLSGGQKQRVAIARALINEPSILLADEPTGNLDSKTSDEILALFDELHEQGHTVLMVTHEADVAAHAKRVIRMRDGKVASDLPVEEDEVAPLMPARPSPLQRAGENPAQVAAPESGGGA
ncbi:efflux RND transporter periplasmic adaptor subunit [Phycisphaeraceae bacterium D3-23]